MGRSANFSILTETKLSSVESSTLSDVYSRKSTFFCVPVNAPSFSTSVAFLEFRRAAFLLSKSSRRLALSISASVISEISSLTALIVGASSRRLREEGLDASSSDMTIANGSKSCVNTESALASLTNRDSAFFSSASSVSSIIMVSFADVCITSSSRLP